MLWIFSVWWFKDGCRKQGIQWLQSAVQTFFSLMCSHGLFNLHDTFFGFHVWLLYYTVYRMNLPSGNMAICAIYFASIRTTLCFCIHGWWTKKTHSNGSSRYILYILSINNLPNKFFVLPHSVDGQLLTAQNAWCLFSSRLDTPKTNISSYPLKTDDWKMNFHLKGSFFSGHVNFRSVCVF